MASKILVIDDDDDILEILHIVLENEGHQVILSNTVLAAGYIVEMQPDLILLDVRISGAAKSGAELCAELKQHYTDRKMPVVLISAESNLAILANDCGADDFIAKPFDIFWLLMQIRNLLK